MAKYPAKCPKCGNRLEFDSGADGPIVCSHCGASLVAPGRSQAGADSKSPTMAGPPPSEADPLIGQAIGQFEIVELLGRGGMGAVYKGRQPSLDRLVAIKVLPERFAADASFVERFGREARAAAAVSHPHIIEIHDVGHDKGFHFIAMELIDGESLADILKREGRVSPDRALEMMKQTASALAAAQARGILHRDIKPSNILFTSSGHVKVADFGLAKRTDVDVSVTQTGQTLGTPLYMPPEAARGGRVDARGDLYSLGATFYQALAGRPPFQGATGAELIVKHIEAGVPPLQELAPDAPGSFCRIIHRLLRKRAADRFDSAEKLLEALARVGPVGGVSTRRVPTAATAAPTNTMPSAARPRPVGGVSTPRVRAAKRRIPLLAALGGLGAIVLVIVLAIVLRSSPLPSGEGRVRAVRGPGTSTPHPGPLPKGEGVASRLERNAAIVLNNVHTCITKKDWPKAKSYLDRLTAKYGTTQFAAAHRADIAALGQQIDAHVKGAAKTTPPKPPPPLPAPPDAKPEAEAGPWKVYTPWPFDAAEAKRRQAETAKALGVPVEQDIEIAKGVKMTMVLIPAGEFLMGCPEKPSIDRLVGDFGGEPFWYEPERPQHRVRLTRPFWLGKYEVTQEQWQALMGANPSGNKGAKHPVEHVSWLECGKLVATLNARLGGGKFRLPTEAEWEHAYRAGAATQFFFGDKWNRGLHEHAWQKDISEGHHHPVGQKLPNPWRLHDMAGNVQELCADRMGPYSARAQTDPLGPVAGEERVRRGGCFDDGAPPCRATFRLKQSVWHRGYGIGVRLARSLDARRLKPAGTRVVQAKPEPKAGPWRVYTKWPFGAAEAKRRQAETAKALGVPVEQDIEIAKGVKMTMVLIPAGEFLMGSPPATSPEQLKKLYDGEVEWYEREFPQHRVRISKPFWLGKTEVTQAQWQAVMGSNPSRFKGRPQSPVEQVSWNDCQGFVEKLSAGLAKRLRLPTEAEWEYACRAGSPMEFHFGDDPMALGKHAWFAGNSSAGSTQPVGGKTPNAWGLHDMHGNVWEQCDGWYAPYGGAPQVDPRGPGAGEFRVSRGGSWDATPKHCRSARRSTGASTTRASSCGFRVALVVVAPK